MTTEPEPVCPRHPDRVAYVRCQRCERPVCPECQRPAAVGVQCVDCVREGAKTVRTARTPFGGTITDGRPIVTWSLMAACLAIFVAQLAEESVTARFAFSPTLALSEPWRFLTGAFLHSTGWYLHIAFNLYALWLTGPALEQLLGRIRFLALYLLSALGGSVFVLLLASPSGDAWYGGTVGASGAVFGLFAALVVLYRRLGRDTTALIGVIVVNAVLGFVLPNVAWQAHLGGMLTGAAVAAVYAGRRGWAADRAGVTPNRRTQQQLVGLLVISGLLLVLVAVKVALVGTDAFLTLG
jgi:membrane associated rhomboid family serine protease